MPQQNETSAPMAPSLAPNPAVIANIQKMLSEDPIMKALKPYAAEIEWISEELERTHVTVRTLSNNRETSAYEHERYLTSLRTKFHAAIEKYSEAMNKAKSAQEGK